jgi:hypothetical protein
MINPNKEVHRAFFIEALSLELNILFLDLILMTSLSLLSSKLEMLGSLQSQLLLGLTLLTFKTDDNLTGGLCFLVEDGLGLSSESHLLRVITTLSLSEVGSFSGLVLGDLVNTVLAALLSLTVSFTFLWYINHIEILK